MLNLTDVEKNKISAIKSKDDVLVALSHLMFQGGKLDMSDKQIDNMKLILPSL